MEVATVQLKYPLKYSFWYDVVYHVLSNLSLDVEDAGRLYDANYIRWINERFPLTVHELRTLLTDASIIAAQYNHTPRAFYLNRFPLLYTDFEDFNKTIETPFTDISWQDDKRSGIAASLKENLPMELLEMFRMAVWSEARAGYEEVHQQHIAPLYEKHLSQLDEALIEMTEKVKGLADANFMVSHPLRQYGRLLWIADEPLILIGLPHDELDIPVWNPVMQGCHQYVLSKLHDIPGVADQHMLRSDSQGYFYHIAPEIIALSIEANLFKDNHKKEFCNMIKGFHPPNCHALAHNLPWEIKNIPPEKDIDKMMDWLAAGEAVPENLKEEYISARDWFLL